MKSSRFTLFETKSSPNLNLTSLADMFTILLTFLLYSLANNSTSIEIKDNVDLPLLNQINPAVPNAFTVTLKENYVILNSDVKIPLKNFSSGHLTALKNSWVNKKIIILAGKQVPYGQIKSVLEVLKESGIDQISIAAIMGN